MLLKLLTTMKTPFNPLIPRTREALDYETNSPHQHLRECIGNSMENMHTDVRVERANRDVTRGYSTTLYFLDVIH